MLRLWDEWAPPMRAMPLVMFGMIFVVLPLIYAPKGFGFILLVVMMAVGLQPHIAKLSDQGHHVVIAFDPPWPLHKMRRREAKIRIHWSNKVWVNRLFATIAVLAVALAFPLAIYLIQAQLFGLSEKVIANRDVISQGLNGLLAWAQTTLPENALPDGDPTLMFGNLISDAVGDLKQFIATVSKTAAGIFGGLLYVYFEAIIGVIVLGVLIAGWDKEVDSIKGYIKGAFPQPKTHEKIFAVMAFYQECLSTLLIGYLEVALTLTLFYFVALMIVPLNLSFGFILVISFMFGFLTAIWKIGGIATKVIGPLVIVANFTAGIGYFGWEFFSMGLFLDLLIKAALMFAIAFVGGALEAYNYTPEVIGSKLGLTKGEMVSTILIFAIGAGALGMVWGVLFMLLLPTFKKMNQLEEETAATT